ncbi:MAG: hypothetical protein H6974_04615 [Gammaproteobacteria bacterium]|nr:hypothetical protein [Gammaproteobacteria bacterium]
MATGASTAQLAILLVDARAECKVQTRRHSFIKVSLLGIRHLLLVEQDTWPILDPAVFTRISEEYQDFVDKPGA